MKKATYTVLALLFLITSACTQEKDYKEVTNKKGNVGSGSVNADVIVGSKIRAAGTDHLMLVSNVGGDKDAPAIAYEIGDPKKVRLVMEKEGELSVYQLPEIESDNLQNRKLIATIPISNLDYKCAKDDFGKCTNREELDDEKEWYEKRFFKPTFEDVKIKAISGLSHEFMNYFSGCFSEVGSKLSSYQLEDGALNFTVDRSYTTSASCIGVIGANKLEDLNFNIVQHFSIVEIGQIASADYVKKPYQLFPTNSGSVEFGFFKTILTTLDPSNLEREGNEVHLVNRWNPKKTIIPYVLSSAFAKPENAALKQATYHAVNVINNSLEQANAKMRVQLKEPDENILPGDLRNSMVIMVEEPIKRQLLGYGPSVANPDTGEIISARAVMYKGIMKMTIRGAYNDFIELAKKQIQKEKNAEAMARESSGEASVGALEERLMTLPVDTYGASATKLFDLKMSAAKPIHPDQYIVDRTVDSVQEDFIQQQKISQLTPEQYNKTLDYLVSKSFFPADYLDFHGEVNDKIKLVAIKYQMRDWELLSAIEQTDVINTLMPVVWVPTLVHEIGHTLGLRHNFSGSNDQENFYSKSELADMNIHRDIKYSSIMDYAYGTANELPVMGKYDIGALRYAYGVIKSKDQSIEYDGALELINDSGESVISPIAAGPLAEYQSQGFTIKGFGFCTDEHVSLNANCNRFDEGISITDITKHYISTYEKNYTRLNLRSGRKTFDNVFGTISYISYLERMFQTLRVSMERVEDISNMPNYSYTSKEWESNEYLKDLRTAAGLSGLFMMDILKTPDALCLITSAKNPSQPLGLFPLAQFGDNYGHCGQVELNPDYLVIGQAGKSFRDRRYYRNPNAYASEIDARGIWVDKLLAAKYLFGRKMNFLPSDKFEDSYLNLPELEVPILNTLSQLVTDQFVETVIVRTDPVFNTIPQLSIGQDFAAQWSYNLNSYSGHKLDVPYLAPVARYFGMDSNSESFQEHLIPFVKALNVSNDHYADQVNINNLLGAVASTTVNNIDSSKFSLAYAYCGNINSKTSECVSSIDGYAGDKTPIMASTVFLANPQNYSAASAMLYAKQIPLAGAAIEAFFTIPEEVAKKGDEAIAAWSEEQSELFKSTLTAMFENKMPSEEASELEKNLYQFNPEVLSGVFTGSINSVEYYEGILRALSL